MNTEKTLFNLKHLNENFTEKLAEEVFGESKDKITELYKKHTSIPIHLLEKEDYDKLQEYLKPRYPMTYNFTHTTNMTKSNSFGTLDKQNGVKLECTLGIKDAGYGWFEIYDAKSGGERWYAEGGIWINNNGEVTDYDGIFELPDFIQEKLNQLGYSTDNL